MGKSGVERLMIANRTAGIDAGDASIVSEDALLYDGRGNWPGLPDGNKPTGGLAPPPMDPPYIPSFKSPWDPEADGG